MTLFINKNFIRIIVLIIAVKLSLLCWSAHPFDFWTFANTIQRSMIYGWNVFEYWNKGNLLIVLWYPLYGFYQMILQFFHYAGDNVLLLHFLFKLPFLLADILAGVLLYQIALWRSGNLIWARNVFLIWFVNPIIFYVYGIHGHYELLVPLCLILLSWALIKKSPLLIAISLAAIISTKYFFVIFIPFLVIFWIRNKRYREMGLAALFTVLGMAVSYIHLFGDKALMIQNVNSILNLSKSTAIVENAVVRVPALNILSALHYLISPRIPISNVDSPTWFGLAQKGLVFALAIVLCHLGYRLYKVLIQKKDYKLKMLLTDLVIFLVYFLTLLTNFQPHYLSWLVAGFMLLLVFGYNIWNALVMLTLAGSIYVLKNEIGPRTFFMDIIDTSNFNFFDRTSYIIMYGLGATIVAVLLSAPLFIKSQLGDKEQVTKFRFYLYFSSFIWLAILCVYSVAIKEYFQGEARTSHSLVYADNANITRGYMDAKYLFNNKAGGHYILRITSQNDALMIPGLLSLSPSERQDFEIYLHLPEDNISAVTLNQCNIVLKGTEFVEKDKKEPTEGYPVPVECVNKDENILNISDNNPESVGEEPYLYFQTKPVSRDYLPSYKSKVIELALLGALYIYGTIYFGFVLLRTISKRKYKK